MQDDGQPQGASAADAGSPAASRPRIPDHELLARIGEGAFGEVWLAAATSLAGAYRAVKIVYRNSLKGDGYDRELRGIQQFERIAREHPNLVNILHVGELKEAKCFFYVMELADNVRTPADNPGAMNPATYKARTLEAELRERGALSLRESLIVAISLTDALAHLHKDGLIHRDVKPANIIFVKGVVKLADIGLVTDVATAATFVGTKGFVPREGPGEPPADIYSLGKVFYEMITGLDRMSFPQLPAGWAERPDLAAWQQLNRIVMRACEEDVLLRYQSAEELRAELMPLWNKETVPPGLVEDRRRRWSRPAIMAAAALVVVIVGFIFYKWSGWMPRAERRASSAVGLTAGERAEGFKMLFNGKNLDGWNAPGSNWACVEGALTRLSSGGDITYENEAMPDAFDLRFEWRIAPGGDSGVLYRPERVEYQILDNGGSLLGREARTRAGALFEFAGQPEDRTSPIGHWNDSRILCEGKRIRHYLNGAVVLDAEYNQPQWEEARQRLKRKYNAELGAHGGYLSLRDEKGQVWYRNIRIKAL